MRELQFAVPVRIVPSPDQPVEEIYGVEQAMDFLSDWPTGKQGKLYQTAFNACFGASVGIMTSEEACRAFAAFCRASGIMAKDMMRPRKRGDEPEMLPI
ncbi:DUF982 domain-containing protein [Mesorhizobium amorphae]|uniref:DUF982 domain-containing protein n=1 Tax=Mesorhizobium amorphae TaxID=71433 RepID=UPI001184BEBB|nr:DUF982 domain-containing protein [Mesorhizobium amorphae]